jgi:glycerol-3-phosphate dehydrogenase (NAD(P)+)
LSLKIGVIGAGAWGATISKMAAENNNKVTLWAYMQADANAINANHILERLPGVQLPQSITATSSLREAIEEMDAIVIALASDHLGILESISAFYNNATPVLILTKGLLEGRSSLFVSDYIQEILNPQSLAVLSGPNIAIEIANQKPAATVIACKDIAAAQLFQRLLNRPYFRPYTATDVRGVELGGVLKNVIALAAGICDALELGTNAKSALMTRGLDEMSKIGVMWGAKEDTFYGLSGIGDLITTCSSTDSRNYSFGYRLISSSSANDAIAENTTTTEGVKTARIMGAYAKAHHLDVPIFTKINGILFDGISPRNALSELMHRDLRSE